MNVEEYFRTVVDQDDDVWGRERSWGAAQTSPSDRFPPSESDSSVAVAAPVADPSTLVSKDVARALGTPSDEDKRVQDIASEALAWYAPYHFAFRRWGIYVDGDRLGSFISGFVREGGLDPAVAAVVVLEAVIRHEMVHFGYELLATRLEDVLRAYTHGRVDVYRAYGEPSVYYAAANGVKNPEEAIASRTEFQHIRRAIARVPGGSLAGLEGMYRESLERTPPGYCLFEVPEAQSHSAVIELMLTGSGGRSLRAPDSVGLPRRGGPPVGRPSEPPLYWVGQNDDLRDLLFTTLKGAEGPSWNDTKAAILRIPNATFDVSGGKGSHARVRLPWPSPVVTLARSKGNRIYAKGGAMQLARVLGFSGLQGLYRWIQGGGGPDGVPASIVSRVRW